MRTTNEPGRRQNSEASAPHRPTLARHRLRSHIRSHVDQTRQEYSRNYGRGHRLTPTQAKGPARANTALEPKGLQPHSLSGYIWNNIERILHLDRSHPYNLQAKIRLYFLIIMGKSKASKRKPEVSGIDQEGSSRAKRYDL